MPSNTDLFILRYKNFSLNKKLKETSTSATLCPQFIALINLILICLSTLNINSQARIRKSINSIKKEIKYYIMQRN